MSCDDPTPTTTTFDVVVQDTTPPAISGTPSDISTAATSASGAVVNYAAPTANDAVDGAVAVSCSPASGSTFPAGTTTQVNCSATDSHSNTAHASFNVTVGGWDSTAPSIGVPSDITAEATSSAGAAVSFSVSFSDPDDAVPTQGCDATSGDTFSLGQHTVTCNATDTHGNSSSASFKINVVDTTGPVISGMPGNITKEATSSSGATASWSAPTANDAVTGARSVSCSPSSGSTFSITTTTVTCSASDGNGNSSSASFTVTVQDTTPPSISVPGNKTVEATSTGGAVVTFSVSASDNVTASPTISCTPKNSGDTFPIGTTHESCTAMDSAGNTSAPGTFDVTVQDHTPPTLTVPSNMTVEATSGSGAQVSFSATASDSIDPSPTTSCNPASGSTFPLGTTTVSCTASDHSGNSSNAKTFTITVQDTTAPTITVPGNITVGATGATAFVSFTVTSSDAVDSTPTITCSKNPAGANYNPGTTHVTCTAKDNFNNSTSASFDVTVQDLTPPTLTVPSGITKEATSSGGVVVTYSATATDAIDSSPTVTCDHPSGSTFPIGVTHVSCTAKDASNNVSAPGTFDVTVADTTAPSLTVPSSFTVSAPDAGGAVVSYSATATDTVDSSPTVNCSKASGTVFPLGATTVTCTAKDSSNNVSAPKSFTVTVADKTPPVVTSHADITTEATSGSGASVTFVVTATDNIDTSPAVTCVPGSGSTFAVGTTQVSCTAKDAAGNTSAASKFNVIVTDTTPPTLQNVPADITTEANSPSGSVVNYTPPTAVDIVDGPIPLVTCTPSSSAARRQFQASATFPLGTTTVTCSATDAHGNQGKASFKVKVQDTTPPNLIPPKDASAYATTDSGIDGSEGPVKQFIFGYHVADIADPSPKVTADNPQFFPVGVTVVKFTATDASGNKSTGTAKFTVLPKPAPGITPPPLPPPGDNTPPGNPRNVACKSGDGKATITWANPTDKDFGYSVITKTTSTGSLSIQASGTIVYKGTATSFTDRGLTNGKEYRYVVQAFDKSDNGSVGVAVLCFPKAALLLAPADGAKLKKIPGTFRWKADPKANYYNLQLYVGGSVLYQSLSSAAAAPKKILSTWTNAPSYSFKSPWTWEGRSYKMTKGVYTWYVWPGYGARADAKYGPLMGSATFQLTVNPKPPKKPKKPKK